MRHSKIIINDEPKWVQKRMRAIQEFVMGFCPLLRFVLDPLACILSKLLWIHPSSNLWLYSPLLDIGSFFNFLIYTYSVGLFGQEMSPSQGRYSHTEQHKQNKRTWHPFLEWDSSPRSQCSSERRQMMPYEARVAATSELWPLNVRPNGQPISLLASKWKSKR
jgi:hypothetical protein